MALLARRLRSRRRSGRRSGGAPGAGPGEPRDQHIRCSTGSACARCIRLPRPAAAGATPNDTSAASRWMAGAPPLVLTESRVATLTLTSMLSKHDNELITRVGPGTPMGELMRRYWLPALLSEELPEPDCAPIRLKLLGEDLVAFGTTSGRPARPGHLVPAPQRQPVLGPQRRGGPALRLPRLEVRRRRQLRRHAQRAAQRASSPRRSSSPPTRRSTKAASSGSTWAPPRPRAEIPNFEWLDVPDDAALRPQALPGLQLAAEPGG